MISIVPILKAVSLAGALFCAGAYVYGYVIRVRGDRRMHVASLCLSGVALASLPVLLPAMVEASVVCAVTLVISLVLATVFQAVTAFRGRRGDRRSRASDAAPAAAAAPEVVASPARPPRAA